MKIVKIDEYTKFNEPSAVVIGKFDGIHRGHIKLLNRLQEEKANGYKTVVFTFDMPISAFFTGEEAKLLQTDEEKEEFLKNLGVDILAVYPVNEKSVSILPKAFIEEVLVKKLNAKVVVAGPDVSYGDKGKGNFELLNSLASECGYKAIKIEKEVLEETGIEISSTYVRESVAAGDMKLAKLLLGRPFSVSGIVEHGRRLGSKMSFPTVNLIMDNKKLLPPYGVYLAYLYVGSKRYYGVANVGVKPTISDYEKPCVETHIFDFDDDLYGEHISVELLEWKRKEMKFASVEELKKQLADDIFQARKCFNI